MSKTTASRATSANQFSFPRSTTGGLTLQKLTRLSLLLASVFSLSACVTEYSYFGFFGFRERPTKSYQRTEEVFNRITIDEVTVVDVLGGNLAEGHVYPRLSNLIFFARHFHETDSYDFGVTAYYVTEASPSDTNLEGVGIAADNEAFWFETVDIVEPSVNDEGGTIGGFIVYSTDFGFARRLADADRISLRVQHSDGFFEDLTFDTLERRAIKRMLNRFLRDHPTASRGR